MEINSGYVRGYTESRSKIENSPNEDKEWKSQYIKDLAESQEPMTAYDHGSFTAMVHFQNGIEWQY